MNKRKIKTIIFIILIINIVGDDIKPNFYKNIKLVKEPFTYDVLINKEYRLEEDYIPYDLVKIKLEFANNYKYLRKEACESFIKMSKQAKKHNLSIIGVSAFRSYKYQDNLYNYYVQEKGIKYADSASARPGHSEHQTGLALDVMGSNNDYNLFGETNEFKWMIKNAYKYGFILRYPKNKEHITGFKYEPWHWRYVGIKVAKIIHNNNITLEEYQKKA